MNATHDAIFYDANNTGIPTQLFYLANNNHPDHSNMQGQGDLRVFVWSLLNANGSVLDRSPSIFADAMAFLQTGSHHIASQGVQGLHQIVVRLPASVASQPVWQAALQAKGLRLQQQTGAERYWSWLVIQLAGTCILRNQ